MTLNITEQIQTDLSGLTSEEVRHIWGVIQRDLNLQKKEKDRIRHLQSSILTEDTKRNLLTSQSNLGNSFCIHCLQPFRFLLKSKCQCRNCKAFICKDCSCFNKKEHDCLCYPCHNAKVLKIGKLEWFHKNTHFKLSGSVKVMTSLYKRLLEGQSCSHPDLPVDSSFSQDDRHRKASASPHGKLGSFHVPLFQTETEVMSLVDLVEVELTQKLKKLAENISDKEKSSDEDLTSEEDEDNKLTMIRKPHFPTNSRRKTLTSTDGSFIRNELFSMQRRPTVTQRRLSMYEIRTLGCELSRIEDEVAMVVARVQSAQSEVINIQNKIAVLEEE